MEEVSNKRLGELIFRLAEGDVEALSDIYLMLNKVLYAVGGIYYKQRADIEDAIQNLLITLYYKAKKFSNNTNAYGWILTMFNNMIKSQLKRSKREMQLLQNIAPDSDDLFENAIDENYIANHVFVREIMENLNEYERELVFKGIGAIVL